MSHSLWSHGLQHARLLCPSLSPRVCTNSRALSRWCYLTISFYASLLSFCHQSFPASAYSNELALCIRWPKYWTSASVLPMNIQGWFPLELTGLISLLSKGISIVFSSTTIWKHQFFSTQPSLGIQLSHLYMTTGKKAIALTIRSSVSKLMSLIFNMLSRFVIAFLPRSKHLLISWMKSIYAVILEPKKIKYVILPCFPLLAIKWWGLMLWS